MGMSASQARLLSLQARQSNLEYQGQQINQERTILSQQCTELYNTLLGMDVPTPPSTQDYTTIEYSGSLNASKFSIGKITPHGSTYSVNLEYEKTGHAITSKGKAQIKENKEKIEISNPIDTTPLKQTVADAKKMDVNTNYEDGTQILSRVFGESDLQEGDGDIFVRDDNGKFIKTNKDDVNWSTDEVYVRRSLKNPTDTDGDGVVDSDSDNFDKSQDYIFNKEEEVTTPKGVDSESEIYSYYVSTDGGKTVRPATKNDFEWDESNKIWKFKNESGKSFHKEEVGGSTVDNPSYQSGCQYTVGGNSLLDATSSEAKARMTNDEYNSYAQAIKNKYPDKDIEDFYVYFTTEGNQSTPHFILKTDVTANLNQGENGTSWAEYYDYIADGKYTSVETMDDCQLTFDADGRITKISIPTRGSDGSLIYTDVHLKAATVTDNAAYEDAFNEYEYAQYEYDKKQQEINAKTEIIQQQDRNLELKLQRLDNERTQITTEIEAVEKVINDNIESSYKTFSG